MTLVPRNPQNTSQAVPHTHWIRIYVRDCPARTYGKGLIGKGVDSRSAQVRFPAGKTAAFGQRHTSVASPHYPVHSLPAGAKRQTMRTGKTIVRRTPPPLGHRRTPSSVRFPEERHALIRALSRTRPLIDFSQHDPLRTASPGGQENRHGCPALLPSIRRS